MVLASIAVLAGGAAVAQAKIYFTTSLRQEGKFAGVGIQRANFDGSAIETLQSEPTGFENGIVVDPQDGKMFWADTTAETIRVANLNGTGVHNLVDVSTGSPRGVTVDPVNKKIYWTETGTRKGISRSNLDGTFVEKLTEEPAFGYIAIDVAAQKLYWPDSPSGKVFTATV